MILTNRQQSKENSLTSTVALEIEGRKFRSDFIELPEAKGNRTLLRADFLANSGFVSDVKRKHGSFNDMPNVKYNFVVSLPRFLEYPGGDIVLNSFSLNENEGKYVTPPQKLHCHVLHKNKC